MLKTTLIAINKTLDNLTSITKADIEDIKEAHHEKLFERNQTKEELLNQFISLKSQIDNILVQRSQEQGLELNQLINNEEDILLGEFKEKLTKFHTTHKKFAKMAFTITNFYNNLLNKLSGSKLDIGYQMSKQNHSNLSIKA